MGGICKYMKGEKCAENYCDMWNKKEKRCNDAVISDLIIDQLKDRARRDYRQKDVGVKKEEDIIPTGYKH